MGKKIRVEDEDTLFAMKRCIDCKQLKFIELDFSRQGQGRPRRAECNDCVSKRSKRTTSKRETNALRRLVKSFASDIKDEDILERDNDVCAYCEGFATSVDHVIPISNGGLHKMDNLVAACSQCQAVKSNLELHDFIEKYKEWARYDINPVVDRISRLTDDERVEVGLKQPSSVLKEVKKLIHVFAECEDYNRRIAIVVRLSGMDKKMGVAK